jgi:hypothetical protein
MNRHLNFRYLSRKIKGGALCDMVRMVGSLSLRLLVLVVAVGLYLSMALQLLLSVKQLVVSG